MSHKSKKAAAKKAKKAAQVKVGKAYVDKILGLTTVPNTPPPGQVWSGMDSATSTFAANLTGDDKWNYGKEASQATNEYLENIGEAKKSSQNPDGSWNYNVTSKGKEMKYGISEGAMGSGDPTGIMGSTPISSKMLQSQNKITTLIQGAIGLAVPAPGGTIAKLGVAKSSADLLQPGAAYTDYTKKFAATQAGKKFTSTRNLFGLLGLTGHKKKTL